MATTATLPDREAEELETRSGAPTKGSLQSVSLPVGRLMSSSTNCEVTVSNDRHRSSARLALDGVDSGTAGLSHGSVREAIAFAINMRNAAVSTIDATFVTSIAMAVAAYRCRSTAASG